jgi:hypothetical protein
MNNSPFNTDIIMGGRYVNVQVRPCCSDNNVVDYAIWIKDKLEFTIAKDQTAGKWVIAMINADDEIEDATLQQLGIAIDKRNKTP